jgi:cardiolipin synthase
MTTAADRGPAAPVSTRILTVPNVMSFARLATVPFFLWLFLSGREGVAFVLYAIGAWSDFLDGYVARKLDQVSVLGKLLDPIADRVFIITLAIALVSREVLPWWLAAVVVARDALIVAVAPVLERRGMERIAVNDAGKTATAALLAGLSWLVYGETEFPGADVVHDMGIGFTAFGAFLYWLAGLLYAHEAADKMRALVRGVDA